MNEAKAGLTEEYYARHHSGGTGHARYGTTIEHDDRMAWFASRVGTGKRVLDLGCRDGTMTAGYREGNDVTGVDVDRTALATAEERLGIRGVHCNVNDSSLPLADGSFDVVVSGEVLEHLQFPDVVVGEVMRVLAPDGVFLGSVPNSFRLPNRLRFLMGEDFESDPTHLHHFNEDALRRLLEPYGTVTFDYLGGKRWRNGHPALRSWRWLGRMMGGVLLWECRRSGPHRST